MLKLKKANVEVVRMTDYDGIIIYVMQYGTMFQYLFAWKGQVYQDHVFLKPRWYKRVLGFFGYKMYDPEDQDYGEQVVLSGAMRSIEALKFDKPVMKVPVGK